MIGKIKRNKGIYFHRSRTKCYARTDLDVQNLANGLQGKTGTNE